MYVATYIRTLSYKNDFSCAPVAGQVHGQILLLDEFCAGDFSLPLLYFVR